MKGKRKYRKPFMVKDNFLPQEYCAPCDKLLTDVNSLLHIDWYPDGTQDYFDYGHEFMNSSGKMSGSTNGKYNNVKVYKLQSNYRTDSNSSWQGWKDYNDYLGVSHNYSTDEFTIKYSPNTRKYKFIFLGSYDIMIKDSKVYHNQS